MTYCYLNGKTLPLQDAAVPVMDRGFLFGDGVYEVVPVYHRRPFCWRRHLHRLQGNLDAITLPFAAAELTTPCKMLIARGDGEMQTLYIQISRGAYSRRQHFFPAKTQPTVFAVSWPRVPPAAKKTTTGVSCALREDFRWRRCDIKSTSLLGAVMLANSGGDDDEETLLHRDGMVSEGASTNVIIVSRGTLVTPPADHRILPGITCRAVLESAKKLGLPVDERDMAVDELQNADEIWLTSSTREVLPVIAIDGRKVGDGKPGAVFRRVAAAFKESIADNCGFST